MLAVSSVFSLRAMSVLIVSSCGVLRNWWTFRRPDRQQVRGDCLWIHLKRTQSTPSVLWHLRDSIEPFVSLMDIGANGIVSLMMQDMFPQKDFIKCSRKQNLSIGQSLVDCLGAASSTSLSSSIGQRLVLFLWQIDCRFSLLMYFYPYRSKHATCLNLHIVYWPAGMKQVQAIECLCSGSILFCSTNHLLDWCVIVPVFPTWGDQIFRCMFILFVQLFGLVGWSRDYQLCRHRRQCAPWCKRTCNITSN